MSRALLDSWQVHEFASGLYPERHDLKDGRLDRFIGGLLGRWAQGGSPLRLRRLRRFAERVEALADGLTPLDGEDLQRRVSAVRAALAAVSYTHLDVYKRQIRCCATTATTSSPI